MPEDHVLEVARGRIGRVLRGKYRLDRVLGVGGMGAVYVATHRNNKQFAIKMLHAEISIHESVRSRFVREGYVANSVKHPGAVAVLDDDVAEDGAAFLVMELLLGAPIDEVWTRHARRMPVPLVLSIGDALLEVLVAAHANGIVHRDLKPANLFLTNDGALKVLDFGIARLREAAGTGATVSGAMLGTPAFMAPEQALAKASEVDGQSDVWSTGATLFTLLCGELVHEGENASQLLVNAATKPARSLAALAPDVPKAIVEVVDRAVAFHKKDRWPSAQAMREALHKASVEGLGTPIATLPKSATPAALGSTPSGLDATVDASSGNVGGSGGRGKSSGTAFAPTAAAPSDAPTPDVSTRAALANTPRGSIVPRAGLRSVVLAGLSCAALVAFALVYRAGHVPRTTYCAVTLDSIDGYRCARPVTEDALVRRGLAYTERLTALGGRVVALAELTFAGRLDRNRDGAIVQQEITRADDGGVREIASRDANGNLVSWERWSSGGRTIDFVGDDGATPRHAAGRERDDTNVRFTSIRRDFDLRGLVARELFFGPTGLPRPDAHGAYGRAFVNGRVGRAIRTTVLAADGTPGVAADGSSVVEETDDDDGDEQRTFGIDGRPTSVDGAHLLRKKSVEGTVRETQLFGLRDEPIVSLGTWGGSHTIRFDWDPAKRASEVSWHDATGRPRLLRGDTYSAVRETFDERGNEIEREYLDPNGNRARRHGKNVTAYRWTFDAHDERVAQEGLDATGALISSDEGYARQTMTRDDHGRVVEQRTFDEAGGLVSARDGGAIQRMTYDDRGLRTSIAYFGPDDRPVANVHGVALTRSKFDRLRNEIERAYFGADGAPVASDEGFSIHRWSYDANDDLVAESYFDATGAPVLFKGEYATVRIENDERGLVVEDEYLDLHGDRILRRDAYAAVKYTRDRNGDVVLESYFGKHDEPVTSSDGAYAKKKMTYDVHRRLIESALFDPTGAAVVGNDGWAVQRLTYDDRGLLVRLDHLDAGGRPVLLADKYSSMTRAYDDRGNAVEETGRGADGAPVTMNAGFATTRKKYDERDELIEEARLAVDGKPATATDGWAIRATRYDDVGNVVEEAYFNGDHQLVMPLGASFASVRSRFDARQRLVEARYLDAHEAPAKGPDGVAIVRYARDTYGRAVETRYLDGSETPAASIEGKLVVRVKYDDAGRPIDERFVDAGGAPRLANDGCAGHGTKYDPQGHKVEEECFGVAGALAVSADGWAVRRTQYDSRGNVVELANFGTDGGRQADRNGIARQRSTYDERNNVQETAFFDAHDRPTRDSRGIHETLCAYDDTGKKTGEKQLDLHGNAMARKP